MRRRRGLNCIGARWRMRPGGTRMGRPLTKTRAGRYPRLSCAYSKARGGWRVRQCLRPAARRAECPARSLAATGQPLKRARSAPGQSRARFALGVPRDAWRNRHARRRGQRPQPPAARGRALQGARRHRAATRASRRRMGCAATRGRPASWRRMGWPRRRGRVPSSRCHGVRWRTGDERYTPWGKAYVARLRRHASRWTSRLHAEARRRLSRGCGRAGGRWLPWQLPWPNQSRADPAPSRGGRRQQRGGAPWQQPARTPRAPLARRARRPLFSPQTR
mmetsp:Transcript_8605/g.28354  ORF Transcript_8605/g.28354 Transcript_8605/m.28354 type:complete len:277 (-) Transcript_8605:341-1171(-)